MGRGKDWNFTAQIVTFLKNLVTIDQKTYSHWAVKEFNLLLLDLVELNGVGFLLDKISKNGVKIV